MVLLLLFKLPKGYNIDEVYMNTPKTIFCDIDGTILTHTGDIIENYIGSPNILENVTSTFKKWDKHNYKIVLVTGRKESTRKKTEEQLRAHGIIYDDLIMGLPNGDRIIINDKKVSRKVFIFS